MSLVLTILKSVLTKPREHFTCRSKLWMLWAKRSVGVPASAADPGYDTAGRRKAVRDWGLYKIGGSANALLDTEA